MGAEKLIGMGDMLFSPLGVGKPERIQGVFVSDEERERVISFIKDRSQANYSEDISAQIEEAGKEKEDEKGSGAEFSEYDELLKDAAVVVIEAKQASVSMLQRRLKLGYSRAARIVDQLEDLGIVGGFEGSKPREVKMTMSEWLEFIGEENGSDDLIIEDEELNEDF
jgi:S-DNA-T family DNA segregation ATPase FtsK/SpoIIIE